MIQIAEVLPPQPNSLWRLVQQVGVNYAVGRLPIEESETPREIGPMRAMKERFDAAGLQLAVIESSPPMTKTRLGLPGRDEEIEWFCTMVRSMGELGIPVVCYNWMAVIGWTRSYSDRPGR